MGGFFCIVKIKKFFVNGGGQYAPPLFSMHYERQITGVFNPPQLYLSTTPQHLVP